MKKSLYDWLGIPAFSKQTVIKVALERKKQQYQTQGITPNEQILKAMQLAERLSTDETLHARYNASLPKPVLETTQTNTTETIPLNSPNDNSPSLLKRITQHKYCCFTLYIPAALLMLYGGLQLGLSYGLFSPSLSASVEVTWKYKSYLNNRSDLNESCLQLPVSPQSKLRWTVTIPQENFDDKQHAKKLQQLDALTNIGFLEKSIAPMRIQKGYKGDIQQVKGYQYHITTKAKAYDIGKNCFAYGKPKFLSIESVENLENQYLWEHYTSKLDDVQKIVNVQGYSGYTSTQDFYHWAQDASIVEAFELQSKLKESFNFLLVKTQGEWLYANVIDDPRSLADWINYRDKEQYKQTYRIYIDEAQYSGFPYEQKIRSLINKKFDKQHYGNSAWYYVPLAGSYPYPVDDGGQISCNGQLKLTIMTETPSGKHPERDTLAKTLPYLKDLEKRGILTSTPDSITRYNQNRVSETYQGLSFKPTEKYADVLRGCGDLGRPYRYDLLSVTYGDGGKLISYQQVEYFRKPYWATDEIIQEWSELEYALRYGHYLGNYSADMAFDIPYQVKQAAPSYIY